MANKTAKKSSKTQLVAKDFKYVTPVKIFILF